MLCFLYVSAFLDYLLALSRNSKCLLGFVVSVRPHNLFSLFFVHIEIVRREGKGRKSDCG